jgi:glycine/D-amino acid oxidase-like deaminating enzyme
MPALAHRGYAAWNGFRPATLDEQPVIQRLGNSSIWLAYGHYRNGILLAPATARLVAQEINQASSRTDSLLPAALPR